MSEEEETKYEWSNVGEDEEGSSNWVTRDGFATVTYPNGDVYEGEFQDKVKHGKGKYTFAAKEDEADEEAVQAVYEGEYINGRRAGLGTMTYPDGSRYRGQWADSKRNGTGSITYSNGDIYSGSWSKDRRHGEGTYLFAESDATFMGDWENGTFASGHFQHKDGTSYEGYFVQQKPSGEGVFRFAASQLVQEGEFMEQDGEGKRSESTVWSYIGKLSTNAEFDALGKISIEMQRAEKRNAMEAARKKFDELDRNHNGVLTADEIGDLAQWVLEQFRVGKSTVSKDAQRKLCKKLLERCDDNNDGVMDFAEFSSWFNSTMKDIRSFQSKNK